MERSKRHHPRRRPAYLDVHQRIGGKSSSARLRLVETTVDGIRRRYQIAVPLQSNAARRVPVLFAFHGEGSSAAEMAGQARLHLMSDAYGVAVVYPEGLDRDWTIGGGLGAECLAPNPELSFVRRILAEVKESHAIDVGLLFAVGYSRGGELVYSLASALAGRLAAIVVVSATPQEDISAPSHPVALLHVHGTHDRRYPVSGISGRHARHGSRIAVAEVIGRWLGSAVAPDGFGSSIGCVRRAEKSTSYSRRSPSGTLPCVEFQLLADWGHRWPEERCLLAAGEPIRLITLQEKIVEFLAPRVRGAT